MSDKDFVFRLGPMPGQCNCLNIYYIYPGQPNNYAFTARDDEMAWQRIVRDYDPSLLACEEELMGPATPKGVACEPYDKYTSRALVIAAFDNLPKHPLRNVKNENLISDFVLAVCEYLDSDYAKGSIGFGSMTAKFVGEPGIRTRATLQQTSKEKQYLEFVFDNLQWLEGRLAESTEQGQQIRFGVNFQNSPDFAVDAMRRAVGMGSLPMPFLGTGSEDGTPNDLIMLLLISALTALSYLKSDQIGATGTYEIGGARLTCFIQ
ncbi:MAG: hypothetical protein R3D30_12470 [Hyphomicrobiales bacterium]